MWSMYPPVMRGGCECPSDRRIAVETGMAAEYLICRSVALIKHILLFHVLI